MEAHRIVVKHCDNANKFRPAAVKFETYGYYTSSLPGTTDYMNFWKEELNRCINGYTTEDGEYISGYFYFYLNYTRIQLTEEVIKIDAQGRKRTVLRRTDSFPRFYDYDRAYFEAVDTAETTGKHLVVVKKRGSGYSYKGASMLVRNFYCLPKSKSYAVAAETEFLTKDGTLTKVNDMLSFIDVNTAFSKRRQKKDTLMHRRASYTITDEEYGIKSEQGYGSEIIGVSLKNDVQKIRGKRAKLILFEEAGKFPGLKEAWQITRPSVEDGSMAFGLMIAYGTGGSEENDYEGLNTLFYEPDGYNCLPIVNEWDEGSLESNCGFFVPQFYNMEGSDKLGVFEKDRKFMDANGNSDIDFTKKFCLYEREKIIDSSSDKNSIDRYIAERPFTPAEATLQISGNIFPKKDMIRHLADIRTHDSFKSLKQVGNLYFDGKGVVKWEIDKNIKDIVKYRLGPGDSKEGAIVVWEHPPEEIPYGLYIMGLDPYDFDQATSSSSLGSAIVYKRFQKFEAYYETPVAEYTGRPETADEFYENVRKLALYYNARILYENEKKGVFDYFVRKKCEYLLADQPAIIKDIVKDSVVQRGKGIHMVTPIKNFGIGAAKDWLVEEYAPGKKNLTKILSEPLLEELIAYNDKGNFDRVIAFILVMIYSRELYNHPVKKKKEFTEKDFFKEKLFQDGIDTEIFKF